MMQTRLRRCLRSAVVLVAAIAGLNLLVVAHPDGRALQAAELATRTNSEGMVTVKVTPQVLSASATELRFEVVLDTHTAELTQDMREISVLSGVDGREYKLTAWEGDPPGGHHRQGVLVFSPISPMPGSLTLKLRGINRVPERIFAWSVSP